MRLKVHVARGKFYNRILSYIFRSETNSIAGACVLTMPVHSPSLSEGSAECSVMPPYARSEAVGPCHPYLPNLNPLFLNFNLNV